MYHCCNFIYCIYYKQDGLTGRKTESSVKWFKCTMLLWHDNWKYTYTLAKTITVAKKWKNIYEFCSKLLRFYNHMIYRIAGIFRVGKFWQKGRLEGVLNFHWVLFSLFQGLSMKTYSRVYFSVCLFFAISWRSRTQRKLNPREKFPIYSILTLQRCHNHFICRSL